MSNSIAGSVVVTGGNGRPFTRLFAAFASHLRAARVRHATGRELAGMSAGELADMGITRHDLSRLFEPQLTSEFQSRGGFNCAPDIAGGPRQST